MDNIIQYNNILVIADEKDLKLFNLEQLQGFTYKQINFSSDLANKQIISLAGPSAPKAIFIGIGSYDAANHTPIDTFHENLTKFFANNRQAISNSNLVFLKPRIKKDMNQIEKVNLARYISTGYGCFLNADPCCVLLTMDRKPRIVSIEYKKLFQNIIEHSSTTSTTVVVNKTSNVEVEKKASASPALVPTPAPAPIPKRRSPSPSSSESSSTSLIKQTKQVDVQVNKKVEVHVHKSGDGDKQIIVDRKVEVVEKNENLVVTESSDSETGSSESETDSSSIQVPGDYPGQNQNNIYDQVHHNQNQNQQQNQQPQARPANPDLIEGRFMLFFKGFDFEKETSISVKQNGTVIGQTEKFSKKEYGGNPYYQKYIEVEFDHNPLNQNLEIIFDKWGHCNLSFKQILANEVFKIHSLNAKKSVKTARFSVIALKPSTAKTTISLVGKNLKKMDMIGKTDPYFKVYLNSPSLQEPTLIYQSETVKNDTSPQFMKFDLYDGRFNKNTDSLAFDFYDEDLMKKSYMGKFEISYRDLVSGQFRNYNHEGFEILNAKSQLLGNVFADVETSGIAPILPSQRLYSASSYRLYMKCQNLEKDSNCITFEVAGKKGKTEKVTKTQNPAFSKPLEIAGVTDKQNFIINLTNSTKKEEASVAFQDLMQNGLNNLYSCRFGQKGILYLQLVSIFENKNLTLQVDADDIPVMDKHFEGSKCDPYFKFYMDDYFFYQSAHQKQTLSASYIFELPEVRVVPCKNIRIEFFDKDSMGSDDVIGSVSMDIFDVRMGKVRNFGMSAMGKNKIKGLEDMRVSVGVVQRN